MWSGVVVVIAVIVITVVADGYGGCYDGVPLAVALGSSDGVRRRRRGGFGPRRRRVRLAVTIVVEDWCKVG